MGCRAEALLGLALQGVVKCEGELRGNGGVVVSNGDDVIAVDGGERVFVGTMAAHALSGEHGVEGGGDCPHVGGGLHVLKIGELLFGHEVGCP